MGKRALTSYDTACWPDRLSFAQEMRESQLYIGVNTCKREAQAVGCLWREKGISEDGRARDDYHGSC
jgi:hypothetical protein